MSPINVIIWSCVAIFIITALLTLLHISGVRSLPNPDHGKILFRALIVEIVVIALGAFSSQVVPDKDPGLGTIVNSMGSAPVNVVGGSDKDLTDIILTKSDEPLANGGGDSSYDDHEDINEYDAALSAAEKIIDLIGQGKYEQIWDSQMSQFFKSSMTRESYKTNLAMARQSLGERRFKNLVDAQYSDGDAPTGYHGSVYAFTYQNTYANITLYERVVVINQEGKGFKMSGFWTYLAP